MLKQIAVLGFVFAGWCLPALADAPTVTAGVKAAAEAFWMAEQDGPAAISNVEKFGTGFVRVSPFGILTTVDQLKDDFDDDAKNFKATKWTIETTHAIDETTGTASGSWAGVYVDKGTPKNLSGYWTDTFIKEDGKWKIVVNTFTFKAE